MINLLNFKIINTEKRAQSGITKRCIGNTYLCNHYIKRLLFRQCRSPRKPAHLLRLRSKEDKKGRRNDLFRTED